MQIRSLSAARGQGDLGGAARAGSFLEGPGLAAMITSGPVRLGLVARGEARVVDLPIASAEEIALLSEDAAVVRDAEHALWSVTGLAGSPAARPFASSVRALSGRSRGGSAVALCDGDRALAVSLSGAEVTARAFQIRGRVRGCDVGEHLTWVVLDGAEGGLLRVHPGATPELGTSVKTTLPADAATLDRVRGGQAIGVVFARGRDVVCAIGGEPKKPRAKLVYLGRAVADAAVIGERIVIAFEDGSAALYDAEAIAAAGDDPARATAEIALGAASRAALVVGDGPGNRVWIGAISGEIFTISPSEAEPASAPPEVVAETAEVEKEASEDQRETLEVEKETLEAVEATSNVAEEAAVVASITAERDAQIASLQADLAAVRAALSRVEAERDDARDASARLLRELDDERARARRADLARPRDTLGTVISLITGILGRRGPG